MFETAVAVLSTQAQWMPINDDSLVDYSTIAEVATHPSPEILLFGDAASQEDILKFFKRHAKIVRIFTYNEAQKQKYCDAEGNVFDSRVVCFGIDTLYENVLLFNTAAMYTIEYICCTTFPKYKTITNDPDINTVTAKQLITSIEMDANITPASVQLFTLCSGINNFEKISLAIMRGKNIHSTFEHLANKRIARGFLFELAADDQKYRCLAVQGGDLVPTMLELVPMHPSVVKSHSVIVLFYSSECHAIENTVYPGWRIQLLTLGSNAPDACKILEPFATGLVAGSVSLASAWVNLEAAQKLMPFIYKN